MRVDWASDESPLVPRLQTFRRLSDSSRSAKKRHVTRSPRRRARTCWGARSRSGVGVLRQEYPCEPSGGCVSEPSTTTLQCRSLCWLSPPKRNWIGSRKTDVTAHRQQTCATTERRL